jgi:hypothetical protein
MEAFQAMPAFDCIISDIIDIKKVWYLVALMIRLDLVPAVLSLCKFNGEIIVNQNLDLAKALQGLYNDVESIIKPIPKEYQALMIASLVNKYGLLNEIVTIVDIRTDQKELIESFNQLSLIY